MDKLLLKIHTIFFSATFRKGIEKWLTSTGGFVKLFRVKLDMVWDRFLAERLRKIYYNLRCDWILSDVVHIDFLGKALDLKTKFLAEILLI